jgi:Na+/H+-translocating membrane pyrophosphatase
MTMRSVGEAAMEMVAEVERQFRETPALLDPNTMVRFRLKLLVRGKTSSEKVVLILIG